jgi:hypothetical protein
MEELLTSATHDQRAKKRLDEQFALFRAKHNSPAPTPAQIDVPVSELPVTTPPASVIHAPSVAIEPLPQLTQAADAIIAPQPHGEEPAKRLEQEQHEITPFAGIMEEVVFWQCVFSTDTVLHISELTRRTRYCGEIFGVIKKPLPQYLNDATQDTLAHNLINRAHHDGLLQETARFSNHAVLWSHNYCYQHGTTTQN